MISFHLKKRVLALLLAALAVTLCACTGVVMLPEDRNAPDKPEEPEWKTTEPADDTLPAEETQEPEELQEPEEPPVPEFVNKLTGEETTEELAGIRPIAVMINNIKAATPQQGISLADVTYEVLAEGGITRLLCLFTDYASLPETGSIRSSRDYFIDLSDAHDAIYVHCGGSPGAYDTLAARKTENMDGIYFNTPFYRNEWRRKNMGMEHSLMTTGEGLVKGIAQKGYRTESDAKQPLSFALTDSTPAGEPATALKVVFSYYATSEFDYNADEGVYYKKQFGAPHIDSNNDVQLSFKNILLFPCRQGMVPGDDKGRLFVDFIGSGEGYYLSDGVCKKVRFTKASRTSSYTVWEEDGETELLLNPGKTYIGLPPTDAVISYNG